MASPRPFSTGLSPPLVRLRCLRTRASRGTARRDLGASRLRESDRRLRPRPRSPGEGRARRLGDSRSKHVLPSRRSGFRDRSHPARGGAGRRWNRRLPGGRRAHPLRAASGSWSSTSVRALSTEKLSKPEPRARRSRRSARVSPVPFITKLVGLAQKTSTAVVVLTEKTRESSSLNSLISLRCEARRNPDKPCEVEIDVLKDKRRGPGRRYREVCRAPAGLR